MRMGVSLEVGGGAFIMEIERYQVLSLFFFFYCSAVL